MASKEDRPWLDRVTEPAEPPETLAAALAEASSLREIQAHRDWLIEGLRDHIANLEGRLANIEKHANHLSHDKDEALKHNANLEKKLTRGAARIQDVEEHVSNLEEQVRKRDARIEDVEEHVINLEKRVRKRGARLAEGGLFPTVANPRVEALFRRAEKIWDSRPDLQERFPAERAVDFWFWLMWHGLRQEESLVEHLYPQPNDQQRARVIGDASDAETYFRSGLVNWWTIDDCLRKAGYDPARGGEILDFGAGCGRVLQFFTVYAATAKLYGADVDGDAMAWCTENLDFAEFTALAKRPPTPYEKGRFDAIYAFSVFSHLREDVHRSWLEELHRIAKPGAAIVLTVQGQRVIETILEKRTDSFFPSASELEHALPKLEKNGIAFFPYSRSSWRDRKNDQYVSSLGRQEYGSTFILESYVREKWTDLFDVIAYEEAPDDWQDYVVLRRR